MRHVVIAVVVSAMIVCSTASAEVQITVTSRVLVNGLPTTEVIVGHDLFLEVWIEDTSTAPAGVDGAFCSVAWQGNRLVNNDNIDDDFSTTADVKAVLNPVFQSGFISGTQAVGSSFIEDIGGASAGRQGQFGPVRLLRLSFTALTVGDPQLEVLATNLHFPIFGGSVDEVVIVGPSLTVIEDPSIGFELTALVEPAGTGTITRDPDLDVYPEDTEVWLSATPATGFRFVTWSGDLDCSPRGGDPLLKSGPGGAGGPGFLPCREPDISVVMDEDKTIYANFVPVGGTQYTLTLDVTPAGTGTIDPVPALETYPAGAAVSIAATPATDYEFIGWSGHASGTVNPLVVVMNRDLTVTANFQEKPPVTQYKLVTTVIPPEGGRISRDPDQELYDQGAVVALVAEPADGFTFTMWTGDWFGVIPIALLVMDSDKEVIAMFEKSGGGSGSTDFLVAAEAMPAMGGFVTVTPLMDEYPPGTEVTLEAVAAGGYVFSGWAGAATGSTNPLTLTIDADTLVTAHFRGATQTSEQYSLSVDVSPGSFAGAVRVSPNLASYPAGTVVTLEAEPAFGFILGSWGGDARGSTERVSVVINRDLQIEARFAPMLGPEGCADGVIPFMVLTLGALGLISRARR